MDNKDKKIDCISQKYFGPLKSAESYGGYLFYISAILSFIILLIKKDSHPFAYNVFEICFLLAAIIFSLVSIFIKLYLSPRAQEARYKDFLSHAFNISLSEEQTKGYYNSRESASARKIAAQTLENSFYSKSIISEMRKLEWLKIITYVVIWFILIFNRNTDLSIIALVAQFIFSEQILTRLFRIEWLRYKFEQVYDDLFRLIQSKPQNNFFEASALEITGVYEMAKANGGITLSSRIFNAKKDELDERWSKIRQKLEL